MRAAVGINRTFASIKTEIVYEVEAFTNTQRSQRAAGILKRALNPDAVRYEVPKNILNTHLVVEEIVKQAGEIAGFANLMLYRNDSKMNTLELVFISPDTAKMAINEGVKIQDMLIHGTPYVDEARRPLIKVNLRGVKDDFYGRRRRLHSSLFSRCTQDMLSFLRSEQAQWITELPFQVDWLTEALEDP
ncbi:hypothetical protein K450DRAFT_251549 [Umbelopsis ramanniana AG]|uniref:Uncharacterized protein n=1 Tax=Umbelopsis ramanniana AG TaxID=1314678 RepID=A0AAD5HAZ2_UMBRA|nr:uncharacterized protein K450DRAFT_251549 [Umbelopsis ramanniana AG]KAI8577590.1 hypothetical protein K450DRAFT_251549 [Umbelopsis ramanniana AG]